MKSVGYLAAHGIALAAPGASPEDEDDADKGDDGTRLPPLTQGETLALLSVTPEKKETQPPPRFNEASLVKFMEENGIGRPSTYAEILRKIEQREYVRKKDRRFVPTALGRTVIAMLIPYFDDFFEISSTARMEERLDEVEEGKISWKNSPSPVLGTVLRIVNARRGASSTISIGSLMRLVGSLRAREDRRRRRRRTGSPARMTPAAAPSQRRRTLATHPQRRRG